MTPFVPADRVDLVTTGFARFLGGDFFSALHILVPQLENTLRHILKHAGLDPSVPALRHQLAHGLISASECYGTDSIYACWFIFRLYCLPLFPQWDHLARRLDTP